MSAPKILLLHPGEMGSAVGARLREDGLEVFWVSEGRGQESARRAQDASLMDCGHLSDALKSCDLVLSVCPPHGALDLARQVAQCGFTGQFVDCNAVAPETTLQIGQAVQSAGAQFTDGGIIGPPPAGSGQCRLYLSGDNASELQKLLHRPPLNAIALDGPAGAASALKMCFSGWNKARIALLLNLRALAHAHGVDEALLAEWQQTEPTLMPHFDPDNGARSVMGQVRKAWRWSPEMTEIAHTFAASGLPDGYHHGAAEVFERLSEYKDSTDLPTMAELAQCLPKRH